MTLLAPGFLIAAAAAIVALIIAHLFSRAQPPELLLPTARFVPAGSSRAASRARRPTDRVLLLLRAAMLALVGVAFAKPVLNPHRAAHARVILVDASREVGSLTEAVDSARRLHRPGDALLAFDTIVRRIDGPDSLDAIVQGRARGSLSLAIVAGIRESATLGQRADSLELIIVSAFRAAELDSATLRIRAEWPGPIRLVRVAGAAPGRAAGGIDVRAPLDDALRGGLALARPDREAAVRIIRRLPDSADSAWAAASDRVLLAWPEEGAAGGFAQRAETDSIGGVVAGGRVVVAAFERRWEPPAARVIARWTDGAPAATEQAHGAGCIRHVAVALPAAGDLTLRREFAVFLRELLAPCGGRRDDSPVSDAVLAQLAGSGPVVRGASIASPASFDSRLSVALLAAALILGAVEHLLRQRAASRAERGAMEAAQ